MALPDVGEYYEGQKADKTVEIEARRRQLVMLAQAEVEAGSLTGIVQWDRFLSYVAAASETCKQHAAAVRDKIADPAIVDHGEIMQLKIRLEGWIQRGFAFDSVIGLPKDLLEIGQDAKALLDRMPKAED